MILVAITQIVAKRRVGVPQLQHTLCQNNIHIPHIPNITPYVSDFIPVFIIWRSAVHLFRKRHMVEGHKHSFFPSVTCITARHNIVESKFLAPKFCPLWCHRAEPIGAVFMNFISVHVLQLWFAIATIVNRNNIFHKVRVAVMHDQYTFRV